MYGTIFIMAEDRDVDLADHPLPWVDNPQYIRPVIVGVTISEDFKGDIDELERTYGIQVSWDGDRPYLSTETLKKLESSLEANLKERFNRIKEIIKKAEGGETPLDDWVLYQIADTAWNNPGTFFYVVEDAMVRDEPEFLDYIRRHNSDLWVVETRNYHF